MTKTILSLILTLAASQKLAANQLTGVKSQICNRSSSACLTVVSETSSQSHFRDLIVHKNADVELTGSKKMKFQNVTVTMDFQNGLITLFKKLEKGKTQEVQFDFRNLDLKDFSEK
jgi:hypothetical protein